MMAGERNVIFALRGDATSKPGGDSRKVEFYRDHLSRAGWGSQVVYSPSEIPAAARGIVHALNLDLPRENLAYAKRASLVGLPFVLSTIRHPWSGIEAMYRYGDDQFFTGARRAGMSADLAWSVREALKLAMRGRARAAISPLAGFRRLQSELLSHCDAVFPLSVDEAHALQVEFDHAGKVVVVPNGFTFKRSDAPVSGSEPLFDIVTVGRIEPRKNTLNLARACAETGHSVAFVGGQNERHRRYLRDFRDLVARHENISYLGGGNREHVASALGRARIYVNPAWFEVVSQADLEATSFGLPVLSTSQSYMGNLLGARACALDPAQLAGPDRAEYLAGLLEQAEDTAPVQETQWSEAVDILMSCYAELIESSAR